MNIPASGIGAVTDPRLSVEADAIGSKELDTHHRPINPLQPATKLFDPSITFEEYHYYAKLERQYEKSIESQKNPVTSLASVLIGKHFKKKDREDQVARRTGSISVEHPVNEKTGSDSEANVTTGTGVVSDEEWHTAARAGRTATWGAVFYLITTDVLGPYSVPWAFTQLGYGPGVALYVVFAAFAFISGYLIWHQFLGLDSAKYPMIGYGDLGFRIFGRPMRHFFNILQSLQFFLNVTLLIISTGQALVQLAAGPSGNGFLCFVVAEVVIMAMGCLLGQIRTLQRFGHFANLAIWLNVFVLFMTMAITSTTPPNWTAVIASGFATEEGPIYTTGGTPPGKDIVDQVNGLMQAVYSYGGATLFTNLLAEMRRPMDFWKALMAADGFIFLCYLIFGLVVYSFQGQATFNPAYQGISAYSWQTVGNTFNLITSVIAAVLYGNIGIKVLYANVGREFLRFPALESRVGKWIWVVFVPGYWILAWIVAAAVPQVSFLGSFVGAAMILQFSYTFPPLLHLGFRCLADSMPADGGFDPATGPAHNPITFGRIWRGFKVRIFLNMFNLIYFLGALTTAILGIYASIVGMIGFYQDTAVTAFSCNSPTG